MFHAVSFVLAVSLSAFLQLPPTKAVVLGFAVPALVLAILPYLIPGLAGLVGLATVAGFAALARLVYFHLKAGLIRHYTLAVLDAAKVGVKYVEQNVAPALRGPDGKLSPDAAAKAEAAALKAAIDFFHTQAISIFRAALGLTDDQLAVALGVAIPAAVSELPPSSPAPARALVPTSDGLRKVVTPTPVPA